MSDFYEFLDYFFPDEMNLFPLSLLFAIEGSYSVDVEFLKQL